MTAAGVLLIAAPLVRWGMVAAISLIEAPLKFQAPGVTLGARPSRARGAARPQVTMPPPDATVVSALAGTARTSRPPMTHGRRVPDDRDVFLRRATRSRPTA
ncbi:hypothetical protein GCM10009530_43480 [Microbispora corallina]|uniref:Secreted protein n=1 Tax=Microbispora corallina TaxID=83302 RepID=A0ABQ4FXB5_9ACTN|nr:hypothetical protein Mco01_23930 [Microbispora corallina]